MKDLVIIGSGPSGLSAAINAGSEGLNTLVIEGAQRIGGQIGGSSKVENYLGFEAVTGATLVQNAYKQAVKFNVNFIIGNRVTEFEAGTKSLLVHYGAGNSVETRAIALTTGLQYKQLNFKGAAIFEGRGVYYGTNVIEHAESCNNQHVFVVGGANSAGQAAMYLSEFVKKVTILVRRELHFTMSKYLIERIYASNNIEVIVGVEIDSVSGEHNVETLVYRHINGNMTETCHCHSVFAFIGSQPMTTWLNGLVALDEQDYIITDNYRTSMRGVFAAGDINAGSTKRVAYAVGAGSAMVSAIHRYL